MKRTKVLVLMTVGATLACDDAHKVGDIVTQGGSPNTTGQAAQGGKNGTTTWTGGVLNSSSSSIRRGTSTTGIDTLPTSGGASTNVGGASAKAGNSSRGGASTQSRTSTSAAGASPLLDAVCTWPKAEFEFIVETPTDYCEVSYLSGTVHILSSDGSPVTSLADVLCTPTRCSDCKLGVCMAISPTQRQALEVTTRSWDGSFSAANTCGSEATSCSVNRCAAAGSYVARYCVAPKGTLSGCNQGDPSKFLEPTACVEVPFDFPTTQVVRGRISSSSSGGTGGAGGATGGTGNGGSAGAGACLPGCALENTQSPACPTQSKYSWVCGATNVHSEMLAAGCSDAMTGAVRYCCPASFQTECQ